jgi:spore coat protein CotF
MNNDADLKAALEQCERAYNKYLLAYNSLCNKGYYPVYKVGVDDKNEFYSTDWKAKKREI